MARAKKSTVSQDTPKKRGRPKKDVTEVVPVGPPSIREIKFQMQSEIRSFRESLVAKYSNYFGHDMRKDLAWLLEQSGLGLASELEREKREARTLLVEAT